MIAIVNSERCNLDNPLSALPGYTLRRAAHAMMAELGLRLAPLGLRVADASVLLLIEGRADMTSAEIGRILDIQRANMVPLLARLEAAGLIERRALNRKSQAIVLAAAGKAAQDRLHRVIAQFEADLLARIAPEHRAHLVPALNALWTP